MILVWARKREGGWATEGEEKDSMVAREQGGLDKSRIVGLHPRKLQQTMARGAKNSTFFQDYGWPTSAARDNWQPSSGDHQRGHQPDFACSKDGWWTSPWRAQETLSQGFTQHFLGRNDGRRGNANTRWKILENRQGDWTMGELVCIHQPNGCIRAITTGS